jgi:hypothetical protein
MSDPARASRPRPRAAQLANKSSNPEGAKIEIKKDGAFSRRIARARALGAQPHPIFGLRMWHQTLLSCADARRPRRRRRRRPPGADSLVFGYNLETSSASATLKNTQTVSGKKLDLEGNWKQEVRRARARCRATPRAARRVGSPDAPARSAGPDGAPRAAASRRVSFASASACADDAQCPHGSIAASRAQNNAIKLSATHKVDSNTKVSLRCAPGAQRCTRAAARRAFPGDRCRKPWLHPHPCLTPGCPRLPARAQLQPGDVRRRGVR